MKINTTNGLPEHFANYCNIIDTQAKKVYLNENRSNLSSEFTEWFILPHWVSTQITNTYNKLVTMFLLKR